MFRAELPEKTLYKAGIGGIKLKFQELQPANPKYLKIRVKKLQDG